MANSAHAFLPSRGGTISKKVSRRYGRPMSPPPLEILFSLLALCNYYVLLILIAASAFSFLPCHSKDSYFRPRSTGVLEQGREKKLHLPQYDNYYVAGGNKYHFYYPSS